ncbi:hypothetical protein CXB51_033938 [Gossypium anomalum]|uniref:Integrase catalytic domain-containing protein n=1 Tax=Gossypium anomalum TaxID=47600 RepID=A0A8J5Y6B0_9ROSI|nr:hypothetical protein CXB51_033938 [Gossypium anomalum]
MASDESLFKDLDRSYGSKIRIGNGELIEAKGRGSVLISTCPGNKVISDVLFVPNIDQNLLSVGQLVEKGYSLVFKNGSCIIKDCYGQEMITVGMVDKCFMLDVNQLENKAYASLADNASLWHRRLGHANFRSLDLLHKQNLVKNMSKVDASDTVCDICQLGKQARLPFSVNQAWRAEKRLELVYFMKHKSEVFEAFNKFKALVENQTSCKIKALRTDNGTKYLSERTVMNMARCLLFQSKLPSKFWAEAVNTSVYLNKLPTRAVKDKTPFEAWYGLKPSVSHLKVFGCVCYVLIPAERRTKLERKSTPDASQFDGDHLDISLEPVVNEPESADIDDPYVKGTRTIADIYHRCNATIVEPSSYEEATRDRCWKKAMEVELDMIRKNETWDLVDRPDQKKVIGVKWVFRAKFCMSNCKPVNTLMAQGEKLTNFGSQERVDKKEYKSLIGYLLYLTATRPDLMHAVSLLSRFIHCCDISHFKAAKRILRYVKGTLKLGVMFKRENELKLIGYSDSDWEGFADDMRSTSGYFFTLGSGVFCWSSKKQQTVAQSTAEAEYIAATTAVNQASWLRKLLYDLNEEQVEATEIKVDNQSAVAIAKNPVFYEKTKHFKIKYHFVRGAELSKEINLVHCYLEVQLVDILTKPLTATRFEYLKKQIGVYCFVAKEEC